MHNDDDDRDFFHTDVRGDNQFEEHNDEYDSHNDTEEEILSYLSSSDKEKASKSTDKCHKEDKVVDQVIDQSEKISKKGHPN